MSANTAAPPAPRGTDESGPAEVPPAPPVVIEPGSRWQLINLRELWAHRDLLAILAWRDVAVRYKQAVLGVTWAVLQPLLTMLIFTLLFGKMAGLESQTGGVPYSLFVFAGLIPWTFFAGAVGASGASVVNSQGMVTKIYFPRLVIPMAAVGASLVDLGVSLLLLAPMMAYHRVAPGPGFLLLPAAVAVLVLMASGVGFLVSALTVAYRDFRYIVPFALQSLMYVSAIFYPVNLFPARWQWVAQLNPMVGVIEAFRYCVVGFPPGYGPAGFAYSAAAAVVLFLGGAAYFRRLEDNFADII